MVFLKVETKFTPQIITPILQADPFGQFEKNSWKSDDRCHCSIFFNLIFFNNSKHKWYWLKNQKSSFEKSDFEFHNSQYSLHTLVRCNSFRFLMKETILTKLWLKKILQLETCRLRPWWDNPTDTSGTNWTETWKKAQIFTVLSVFNQNKVSNEKNTRY